MLFSLIIPTYNRAFSLKKVLETVLLQSYPFFEVIVIDDGGTDNSEEVVTAFNDHRLKYFWKENQERAAARNVGIQKAIGEYITFLDSDDYLLPNHFSFAKSFLEFNSYPDWFHLPYAVIGEGKILSNSIIKGKFSNEELLNGNFLSCMGVFLKREVATKNLFNEDRALSGSEDHELWIRIASQYKLQLADQITSVLNQHDSRSVMQVNPDVLITRQKLFLHYVLNAKICNDFVGKFTNKVVANSYSYVSLHLALTGKYKVKSFYYWIKSVFISPRFVFSKRCSAILKHLICKL